MQKFKKFEGTDLRNSPSLASTERFTRCFAASTKEERRTLRRRLVLVELIVKLSKSCRAREERERETRGTKEENRRKGEKGERKQKAGRICH